METFSIIVVLSEIISFKAKLISNLDRSFLSVSSFLIRAQFIPNGIIYLFSSIYDPLSFNNLLYKSYTVADRLGTMTPENGES